MDPPDKTSKTFYATVSEIPVQPAERASFYVGGAYFVAVAKELSPSPLSCLGNTPVERVM